MENMKFVKFELYCRNCKHYEKREDEDPCFDCLDNPVNVYSHKPVKWEEKQ